jgi:uncharacterized protein YwqG
MFGKLFGSKKPKQPSRAQRDVKALTASLATPALHLVVEHGKSRSYFLGEPEFKESFSWPHRSEKPLDFIAAIDCAEMQNALNIDWLPTDGALLFFYDMKNQPWGYDPKDQGGWAVVHVPHQLPCRDVAPFQSEKSRRAIRFRPFESLPSWERPAIEQLDMTDEEGDTYCDLCDGLFEQNPKHQLIGFPSPVQGDHMELESQLASNGIYCGNEKGYKSPEAKRLEAGAAEWRLLLQIDSDDALDFMWGDAGVLYFWIREEDARNRNFSKTWLTCQCT